MTRRPILSTKRAVEIFEEAISCRRIYCADSDFFKMTDFLRDLFDGSENWTLRTYRTDKTDDFKRKAAVMSFAGRTTVTVDEKLWQAAERGDLFFNYMLAHEVGHLVLNHHATGAVTKHYKVADGPMGFSNLPPTVEELEANYAGAFFQCGVALLDPRWDALSLARRAYSDPRFVEKAQKVVRLEVFQRLLNRPAAIRERIVL